MSKGIDIPIDYLLANFTASLWTTKTRGFYGRVFRNERFGSFTSKVSPEVYVSASEPAKEVLKDDTKDAQCFFDVQPTETVIGDVHTANVLVCFMVNLLTVYPSLTRTEATEQVMRDVEQLILSSDFDITGTVRGFTGFAGYDWGDEAVQAKTDMHPHYLFRFDTTVNYVNC